MKKNEIILFEAKDGKVVLPVQMNEETVWVTQAQMCQLFERSQPVIARHIANTFKEGEVDRKVAYAKFAYTTRHGAIAGKEQTTEVWISSLRRCWRVGWQGKEPYSRSSSWVEKPRCVRAT